MSANANVYFDPDCGCESGCSECVGTCEVCGEYTCVCCSDCTNGEGEPVQECETCNNTGKVKNEKA